MNQPCLEVGQREFIQEAQFPFERLRLWLEAGQLPWVLAPLLLGRLGVLQFMGSQSIGHD